MEPTPMDAARTRLHRYQCIAADPRVASRTSFFAAAVIVTRALATRDQPAFLATLAARLEVANLRRAGDIRAGELYRAGSVRANTVDFVRFEQALVQEALDDLLARDPTTHGAVIACANAQIARASGVLVRWMNREFGRAASAARWQLGREVDFAQRADRELLGIAIAWESLRA